MLLAMKMPCAQAQDLRVTPHNLARQGAAAAQSEAGELCAFCHAPSAPEGALAPRWQRALEMPFAFPIYDDTGSGLRGRVGSHSLACLSCHDTMLGSPGEHPVGIPFRGPLDGKPRRGLDYKPASRGTVDGRSAWWVSALGTTGSRTRKDLPLFARSAGEEADPAPLIECGTCHDPHSTAPLFLRLRGRASDLCLTCHDY